ncbi:adenylyltransferase/cytidyltransferase family protein [Candidatus Manganitrophus noduliformans]|uniref:Adenylyltransferase/cytidyltransferase family protein n=1 Tax=Candidatus Manganitrophus noduliformans TaxID=2606439 RepID=A0A7X6ID24_9BACT|nr:adenylyltransferase/cytidyltransferase family protein [Candidatus Manganitrophus noduliformans]NKE73146.1 adenylyltransferase/cytidyltransferase family protein [Candidatus Manganitrophus noduliformans]
MNRSQDKVLKLEGLAEMVRRLKEDKKTVALCHGCFDIMHIGHLRHFEAVKAMADVVVVTVTPDRFVNKGPNRPVFPDDQRAELIAGLRVVDWVAINSWSSAVETIRLIRPNLFVKGQEYEPQTQQVNPNFFAEAKAVEEVGGKVTFTYEFISSSTAAVKRLWNIPK